MSRQTMTRRFTVNEYYRMGEAGILAEDERVELIDGEIISMTPIGPHHATVVTSLTTLLAPLHRQRVRISVQNPVRLDEGSEPEPDVAVVRPRSPGFPPSHPTPDDVLLLIEVADTSFDFDLRTKIPLYARHGIPEVWLVNLTRETIIIHRDPAPDGYRTIEVRRRGDHVSPSAFPDQQFAVDEILD